MATKKNEPKADKKEAVTKAERPAAKKGPELEQPTGDLASTIRELKVGLPATADVLLGHAIRHGWLAPGRVWVDLRDGSRHAVVTADSQFGVQFEHRHVDGAELFAHFRAVKA